MKDSGTKTSRAKRRAVLCANGYVVATTLPAGELYPTPWGLSEIEGDYVSGVAQTERLVLDSIHRNNAGLFPIAEGATND